MRVSYNGYYVSFPRKRRGFDYLHPHQKVKTSACICFNFLKRGRGRAFYLHPHFMCLLSLIFTLLAFAPASALPSPTIHLASPRIIIYNLNDDKVLYEKDADTEVSVASLTKLMTATLVLEDNFTPTQTVALTPDMLKVQEEFAVAGFKVGQQPTVDELMYALMLPSAADAAQALAINDSGSLDTFVVKMNTKAQELGLTHTHFSNPVGYDEGNYSSARDIATLLKYDLKIPNFQKYFEANEQFLPSLNKTVVKTVRDTGKKYNLDTSHIVGAKTGYTEPAGRSLASTTSLHGVNYLAVNLNAPSTTADSITDAIALYNFYDSNYSYRTVKTNGEGIKDLTVKDSAQKTYTITAPEDIKIFLPNELDLSELQYDYEGITEITRGTKEGTTLGTLTISWNGENLYQMPVTLNQKIDFYPYEVWIILGVSGILFIVFIAIRKIPLTQ